jgi:hypothetical protein
VTKDEIIKIAQKITGVSFPLGIDGISIGMNEKHLQDFANAIMEAEREACVKDVSNALYGQVGCGKAIEAIRARGNNDV